MPKFFEKLKKKKSKQTVRPPLPFSVTQPEVPVKPSATAVEHHVETDEPPAGPGPVPTWPRVEATTVVATTSMPLGLSPALNDWQDFPPGIATPKDCTYVGQISDGKCEGCGAKTDARAAFIDPIPQVRILSQSKNPLDPPSVAYRERGLCPQCYSKRYSQRYPGITPKGIPD